MIERKMPKMVKIVKKTHDINWWYRYGLIGQTFRVLDISPYDFVKIEYEEETFGWLPLEVCEVNPHLNLVKQIEGEFKNGDGEYH